jgi:hypothetical protein
VSQIATVGLVDGLWDNGAIGTQEESAAFRRNTIALRVLRDFGPLESVKAATTKARQFLEQLTGQLA